MKKLTVIGISLAVIAVALTYVATKKNKSEIDSNASNNLGVGVTFEKMTGQWNADIYRINGLQVLPFKALCQNDVCTGLKFTNSHGEMVILSEEEFRDALFEVVRKNK